MKNALSLGLAVMIASAASGDAWARPRDRDRNHGDNDLARAALQRGEILPITRILPLVAQYLPGDVVEVKLESRRDRLNYEIRVLTSSGRIRKLVLDARTGASVAIED
jgi:uncharacterized membrane protein YkoI